MRHANIHVENDSSIGFRSGEYGGRKRIMIPGKMLG
jgi:hypothetical protein